MFPPKNDTDRDVMRMPKQTDLQYWPKSKPIPAGWKLAHDLQDTHHGAYSIVIVRVK